MIYVEYERATSLTDAAWWARCDDCTWTSGPHPGADTEGDPGQRAAERAADQHALEMGEVTREELDRDRCVDGYPDWYLLGGESGFPAEHAQGPEPAEDSGA